VQQDRIRRTAEYAYVALVLAVAFGVWREASRLPPAPYDPLGPKAFPMWVSYALAGLGAAMLVRLLFGRAIGRATQSLVTGLDGEVAHAPSLWTATTTLLLGIAYAAALSVRGVPFLPATAAYLFLAGGALGPFRRRRLVVLVVFALVAAAALDVVFRALFSLDLT
jgi:methyl coenzyme M reductase beta subunit